MRSEICIRTVSARTRPVARAIVILLALKKMSVKKKDLITLQDPEAKYPLPLIEKEVVGHLLGHLNLPLVRSKRRIGVGGGGASWEGGVSSYLRTK